ncbi:hypothetical protein OIN60_10565 [Paenibacillus sp. P96]|uniref:Lipoprotein n=1 Tax=Paenibacillus zeirhizosphaerae TaxID=2987519 RepID=A0ABT9FRX5_9BACL|nr:hypothetical protein [Paenibacillus sp. P96]MDP4097212.1 hypothetical protein [Paenibacillus sp. P96]
MYRNNFKIILLLMVLLLVTACTQREVVPRTISEQPVPEKIVETNQKDYITGKEFPNDDDFDVRDYNFLYDEKENSIVINIWYKFGQVPKRYIIDGQHSYYLYLTVPEDLNKYFKSPNSDVVKGETLLEEDSSLEYQSEFKIPLKDHVSPKQIQTILKQHQFYTITLFENPDAPAKKIINVFEGLK